jgi:hypothetical protein
VTTRDLLGDRPEIVRGARLVSVDVRRQAFRADDGEADIHPSGRELGADLGVLEERHEILEDLVELFERER